MADINSLIAEGAQFNMPNQLGQFAKMQQIQQGMQQQQLNAQQMQTGALQQKAAEFQLQKLQEDHANMVGLQQKLSQQGLTPRQFFEALQSSKDPQRQQAGIEGLMKLGETEKYDAYLKSKQTIPAGRPPMQMGGALGTGTFGLDQTPGTIAPVMRQANALAPQAAPAAADPVAAIDARIAEIQNFADPRAQAEVARLQKQRDELVKPHVVGDFLVSGAGNEIFKAPKKSSLLTQEELAQQMQLAAAKRPPGTIVNLSNVQEKAEKGERGKLLVNQYDDISKTAKLAAKTLPSIEANLNILNKGFDTGFGTETIGAAAKVLGALGVKDAEKFATDSQVFLSNATQAVLQKQLEQKGPQTESDAQRINQIGAELGKTKDANQFVLSIAKAQLKRDVEQRNFYDNWWKKNDTYDGAENAWYASEGGRSLFDRPELKQYAAGITPKEIPKNRTEGLDKIFGKRR